MLKEQVAIITPSKFPGTDGSTANFSEMINQLRAEGFKILLLCPKNPDSSDKNPKESSPSFRVVRIPYPPPRLAQIKNGMGLKHYVKLFVFLIVEFFIVLRALSGTKIRYVFLRHSILTFQLPLLLKLIGIRIIADGELYSDITELSNSAFSRLIVFYEKQIIKMYTFFKVTTLGQAEIMERCGFSKERIMNLPVSIDIDRVPRFSIEEIPKHTFGYFGVLERWQGVDILLKAFQILYKKIPTATLYIIGEGSMKDSMKEMVSQNDLSKNVIFVNSISREALWYNYFSKFRIVMIPRPKQNNSIDTIMPIKLVESLAGGKPIIAIDISVMREIPQNSIILVPSGDAKLLADAMEMLSNDNMKLQEYGEAAIRAAINYDIKINIKKVIAVLSQE
jgi:glycosyltransferase involved in cell wall biosynthesis